MIEDFHFLRPWWLLVLLAPIAIVWMASRSSDIRRQWNGIIAPHLLDRLVVDGAGRSRIRPWWLLATVMTIAIVAAAGPTWQREAPPFVEDTAPLVIAIDLSPTMDAIDITPSRLERAKLKVRDIVALRGGARTAVVAYAGSAHVVLPLTEDTSLIGTYVDALATRIMPVDGKDTAKALQLAQDMLAREDAAGTILFVTDGVEQKAFEAFKRKTKDGFVVLGVGTAEGSPVKTADGGFLADASGARIFAKLDIEALKNLHALTGADVATLTADDIDVRWVAQRIRTNFAQKTSTESDRWRDLGWWLVIPIVLLFALSFRKGWVVRLGALLIAVNITFGSGKAEAAEFIDMWLTADQQGRRAFEQGKFEKAAAHFQDPMWKGTAFGAEPFARATVDGKGPIVPGQQVHVTVDVFAPNFFMSPPQFPLFDLPNAVVTLSDERAQNLVETIDDVQYSGIRRTYMVVPEMAGTFTLPPAVIDFGYSDDGKAAKGTALLPPTSFTVGDAPGGKSGTLPFAARGVVLSQSFDRDPAKLKVGEALVRTVTVFGEDTQAMMIPSLDLGKPSGLKAYLKPPEIADDVKGEDGTIGSSRTQTITYVAEAAGTFAIPKASLDWFDVDVHAAKTVSLPATILTVENAPAPVPGIAPQLQTDDDGIKSSFLSRTTIALAAVALCLLAGIAWLLWRLFPVIKARLSVWRALRRNSENTRFKRLAAAIRKDDATIVYSRLEAWSRSAGFRSVADWVSAAKDADVAREIGTLEYELFANAPNGPVFDRGALLRAITKARHTRIRNARPRPISHLPELNPT